MTTRQTIQRATWRRLAQLMVVVLCAATVKLYYSTASVNQLRWILAPTSFLVELVSGQQFEFESHAGYINSSHTFVIAVSCAGVNFLITAFLMLALRKLWANRLQHRSNAGSGNLRWAFIPLAAIAAYAATLVANTVRIAVALQMRQLPVELGGLNRGELHRLEGIFVYFGFLLLLFVISEKMSAENDRSAGETSVLRRSFFPLLVYYATTLGIPLVTGAYRGAFAADLKEYCAFVLLTPLLLIVPLALIRVGRTGARKLLPLQRAPPLRSGYCPGGP